MRAKIGERFFIESAFTMPHIDAPNFRVQTFRNDTQTICGSAVINSHRSEYAVSLFDVSERISNFHSFKKFLPCQKNDMNKVFLMLLGSVNAFVFCTVFI